MNALLLISPEDREKAIANILQSLSGDYLGINRYMGIKKDGSTFPVLIHSSPIRDDDGIIGIRGTITDISTPSEVESLKTSLLDSESKYQLLVESVSDWIWEVDTQGQYTFSNQKVKDILGYEKDDVIGRKFSDFMEPEEAAEISEIFFQHVQSKKAFSGLENANIRKDGTKVLLETSGEPIIDEQNKVVGYRGVDRDITIRKEYEETLEAARKKLEADVKERTRKLRQINEQLKASEELYRGLVETMGEGLIVTDEKRRIVFANPRLCQMVNLTEEEMLGRPFDDFLTRSERNEILAKFKKRQKGDEHHYEVRIYTRDGVYRWIRISPRTLRGPSGRFKGTLAIFSDVSEIKNAEIKLKEKSRHLEEANLTLGVTLRQCDEERINLEKRVLANINKLIVPCLKKAMSKAAGTPVEPYLPILESNLKGIASPFSDSLAGRQSTLTPTELQVADLIRNGKSTKEIAFLMAVSPRTVDIHRGNIRRKLGLIKSGRNLRSYLLSLT
jgi:PAS domain S-box-containing protein